MTGHTRIAGRPLGARSGAYASIADRGTSYALEVAAALVDASTSKVTKKIAPK